MTRTLLTPAGAPTPRSDSAVRYLLAYLEEERLCVYGSDRFGVWVGRQLPEAEELRIEAELRRLRRSGRRTAVLEVRPSEDGEQPPVRVLCVGA